MPKISKREGRCKFLHLKFFYYLLYLVFKSYKYRNTSLLTLKSFLRFKVKGRVLVAGMFQNQNYKITILKHFFEDTVHENGHLILERKKRF
jgi:hypothetical protein